MLTNRYKLLLFLSLGCIASLLKLSFMVGSYHFYFSGLTTIFPLMGMLFSALPISGMLSFFMLYKMLYQGVSLLFGIPTLITTFAWALHTDTKNSPIKKLSTFLLFVLLPASCILIFTTHPIAKNASAYALYWLIPILIYAAQNIALLHKNLYLQAIQCTFIAHATGSILWLYTMPISAEQWNNLIPIVAIERTIFALSTILFLQSFLWLEKKSLSVLNSKKYLKGVLHGNKKY